MPIANGGLSGPTLIPYVSEMIKNIKKYQNTVVIAGGGIQNMQTLNSYKNIGATNFSVSSLFIHPIKSAIFFNDYYKNINKS